jgi:hypothetical protein
MTGVVRRGARTSAAIAARGMWLVGLLCAASPAAGQQGNASIVGQVSDESGAVLPGVTVSTTSASLQLPQMTTVTDERGEYRLTPLPIGTYVVTYSLDGFQSVRREGIRLTVDFSARLDIALKVGSLQETVTVSGAAPIVDVTSTSTRTELTKEALELVPTSRNGIIGLMAQAPGVRPNLDVGGNTINAVPQFRAFGQDGESWQMIEGVTAISPKSGTQSGQFWDYASFEEAHIETIGHNAEIPTRGVAINAMLKSGGNDFHGTGFWAQTTRSLQSSNLSDALRAQGVTTGNPLDQRWDISGDIGGRLRRDRLWFYYSARSRRQVDEVVNAFKPDGSPATTYRGQTFSTEKVSYQMSRTNRIDGFAQWTRKDDITGVSQFVPWESRSHQINDAWSGKVEMQSTPSSTVVTSLQFGAWGFYSTYTGYSDKVATTDQLTSQVTGLSTAAGQSPIERRLEGKGSVSWFKPELLGGDHQIKVGAHFMSERGDRPWVTRGSNLNYQLIFRNGVPFQLLAYNYPIDPKDLRQYLGAYFQDSWTLARRLTLNLGLRYAHDRGYIPEQCRDAAEGPAAVIAPAQCFQQIDFNVWNPIVLRTRASFDVLGNGRSVIKGGWGRYAHMRMMDELQQANANAAQSILYNWRDLNGNRLYEPGEVNLDPNGSDYVSTSLQVGGAPANGVPNPNEEEPMSDEFSLQFEQELLPGFALRATGIYSRNTNSYRLQNNKRPYEVYSVPVRTADPGPDGRAGSGDEPGTTIGYWDYPASYAGAAFQQVTLINDPRANDSYKSFELAASRRLAGGWQFMVSYSATKRDQPLVNNTGGGLTLGINTFDPNAEIFAADTNWEWLGRASGAYTLPYGLLVSANYEHRSGNPFARTVSVAGGSQIRSLTIRVEPIGTRRLPNINLMDVRLEKNFRLTGRQSAVVRLNMYNFLNVNTITGVTALSGPNFLRPSGIVPPRQFELSASYRF